MDSPITKLKNHISKLTATQRKVADYIIKNPMDVAFLTVDQLAGIVGTSTTTIMRLAFSLGYSGYAEFQKELQELLRNTAAPHTRLEANLKSINERNLLTRCADNAIANIQNTVEMNAEETLNKSIEWILAARRIYCASVRSGLPVVQFLNHGFNRLLGNSELILADLTDWVDKIYSISSADVIIATSFPRYARRTVDFVKSVKENQAKVIAITDSYASPLVKYSDIVLLCNASSLAFHNSVISSLFLADYLISAIAINYPEKIKNRLDRVNTVLTEMNYHYNN
ncbi:MurR/RpiR family transcriptional regulator [Brevibacillus marinus]|uniref:MurR/RpiR family transcriptional regulator n=1 Tax=Brevibacillus marinus TaxID=2496837 RepID=UPI000F82CD73|nr:MurR/RpiR family transcriptional regulator [Brevibacillus marinus]